MKQKLLLKTMLLLCALVAGSSSVWAKTTITWTRVTSTQELFNGGTFIMGYEATAKSGTIVPLRSKDCGATTSANGYFYTGTTNGSSTNGTIDMSNLTSITTSDYEVYISGIKVNSVYKYINIQRTNSSGNYYGASSGGTSSNTGRLYTSGNSNETNLNPEWASETNNQFKLSANVSGSYKYLKYNTGSPRFAFYNSAGEKIVFYKKTSAVAEPTFSVAAGTYTSAQNVTLACATDGATIYYTTDGTTPTSLSTQYTDPIPVSSATTIKAIAIKDDEESFVATAAYTILPVIHAGTEADPYTVADARNAIDANTGLSNVYVSGIVSTAGTSVSSGKMSYWVSDDGATTTQLQAYKGKNVGNTNFSATSDLKLGDVVVIYGTLKKHNSTYELDEGNYLTSLKVKPATPTFSLDEGLYTEEKSVTLSCTTDGAAIYYTTDGTNPTSSSTLYTSAITVDATTTIKAIAIKEGVSSDIASATYTINLSPFVTVSPTSIDATAEAGDGEITVTYGNMTSVAATVKFYESDGTTETTYDWIDAEINISDNVYYIYDANTGAARTAYLKVYTTSSAGEIYSDLITITQAEYVPPVVYNLTTSIVPGKHYIIVGKNGDAYEAMGYDKGNNRDAVDVTVTSNSITLAENDGVYEFVIYGPDADGRYSIYDETTDKEGYLYAASSTANQLKTQATNNINGKWTITFNGTTKVASIVAEGSSNRNVMQYNSSSSLFACYASASQSGVYLYEKDGEATPTANVAITSAGWASYSCKNALDFTGTGVTAYIAKSNGGTSSVTLTEITKVPAETGIVVNGSAATHNIPVLTGDADATTGNLLKANLTPQTLANTYYTLAVDGENKPIFKKSSGSGTLAAGKAYLDLSGSSAPSLGIDFGGTTGINAVNGSEFKVNGEFYNLAGQRVAQPTKGLYIVNGKKVIIK